jgi:hypothetical protein
VSSIDQPMPYELVAGAVSYTPPPDDDGSTILPHGPIEALLPDLWRVVGAAPTPIPMPRSMYIWRMADGRLLLYSVIAMDEEGMHALDTIGRPAVAIVPHPKHTRDVRFYKARYPTLEIVGAADAQAKVPAVRFDAGSLDRYGATTHVVPGMKITEEVLELPVDGGRALLFTDLVNDPGPHPGLLARLFGPPREGGVARVLKLTQIANVDEVRAFLWKLAALPSVKLVAGCHGDVVRTRCAEWLSHAAAAL